MKKQVIIELHYLPSISWFACLSGFEKLNIEVMEFYAKQTHRNRCYINAANGTERLVVPVHNHQGLTSSEILIDYNQHWIPVHLGAIRSAYGRAPFFEHYFDRLEQIIQHRHERLVELNLELLNWLFGELDIEIDLTTTGRFEDKYGQDVMDLRTLVRTLKPQNVRFYTACTYQQLFGKNFVSDLSIIDLLFCEGPNAGEIVKKSGTPVTRTIGR